MTLYTYDGDPSTVNNSDWPLSTETASDGSKLFTFSGDKTETDANGDGLDNGMWHKYEGDTVGATATPDPTVVNSSNVATPSADPTAVTDPNGVDGATLTSSVDNTTEANPDPNAKPGETGAPASAAEPAPDTSKDNPADTNAVDSQVNPEPGSVVSSGNAGQLSIQQPETAVNGSSTPAGSVEDTDGKLNVKADQSLASVAADPDVTLNGTIDNVTYTIHETSAKNRLPGTYNDIEVEFSDAAGNDTTVDLHGPVA